MSIIVREITVKNKTRNNWDLFERFGKLPFCLNKIWKINSDIGYQFLFNKLWIKVNDSIYMCQIILGIHLFLFSEYGKFHYFLLAVCGFVSTSEEMDVISMSFILPSAQCDLKLDTQAKGWLNSIIFIGMMAGAYAWGSVADALGRRKVLIAISFMNALCIVASSFSQSYELFMFFRFLNGAA